MRNLPAIGPTNVTIKAGATPLKEMIEGIKRGVLVQRFAGFPQAVTGDFSGVVKGGFLIENGELTAPLTETLIFGNAFELLKHVAAVSLESRQVGAGMVAPHIRIDEVSITGK
jgi:PmbA protein